MNQPLTRSSQPNCFRRLGSCFAPKLQEKLEILNRIKQDFRLRKLWINPDTQEYLENTLTDINAYIKGGLVGTRTGQTSKEDIITYFVKRLLNPPPENRIFQECEEEALRELVSNIIFLATPRHTFFASAQETRSLATLRDFIRTRPKGCNKLKPTSELENGKETRTNLA